MAKILLIDDEGIVRDALKAILTGRGHQVFTAGDGPAGLVVLQKVAPDLIILDRELPRMTGLQVLGKIRGVSLGVRTVVLSRSPDADGEGESNYRRLGAAAFLSKGMGIEALLKAIERELAKAGPSAGATAEPAGGRILVVDDEPAIRTVLKVFLERKGYSVKTAADGQEALEALGRFNPELILLDFSMPRLDGLRTLRRLREARHPARVIMISADDDLGTAREALGLGASDYIVKPFNWEYLEMSVLGKILAAVDAPRHPVGEKP